MKDLTAFTGVHFTHRGLHDNLIIPENSLEAYRESISHGFGIEFDVYLTDDNNLIIHHDLSLKRTCGIKTTAYKVDTTKLDDYKLYNTEHSIPLLSQMLELVNGRVPLILEIKTTGKIKATCEAIYNMISHYNGPIAVESFDPRLVNWWIKHHPEYIIGQLYGDNCMVNAYLKLTKQYKKVDFLALSCKQLTKPYYHKIKNKGKHRLIVNWTVKTHDDLDNAIKYADNYIFEYNAKNENYITLDDVK